MCWFGDDQNFQEEENSLSRKLKYGQTYSKVRAFMFGFNCLKRIGVLVFGKGLSGNIGSMEVSGFDYDLFWVERENFVFWIWDKEHNNQTKRLWQIRFSKDPENKLISVLL